MSVIFLIDQTQNVYIHLRRREDKTNQKGDGHTEGKSHPDQIFLIFYFTLTKIKQINYWSESNPWVSFNDAPSTDQKFHSPSIKQG